MKTTIKIITALTVISGLLFTTSCKKNNSGGNADIHAMITNNGKPINHSTVYIKYGTKTEPSNPTSDYDMTAHGEETDNHVHIEGLRPGDYFLYAVGTNTTSGKTVSGGIAVEIKWSQRKEMIEADIEIKE